MFITPSFKKSLIVQQFQGNYLKQGKLSYLNNYRLISVIFVVAKVFERIVYDQLYNFLNREA